MLVTRISCRPHGRVLVQDYDDGTAERDLNTARFFAPALRMGTGLSFFHGNQDLLAVVSVIPRIYLRMVAPRRPI